MAAVNSVGNTLTGATGTGNFVGANTPTLITPVLGVATATSLNKMAVTAPATASTLSVADGKTFTCSNTLTFTGTDSSSVNFGAGGTVAYSSELTSWVAYTPTFVGFGTPTSAVWSRRVGDTLEIRGVIVAGTTTATEARMTLGFNGIDGNVTASTASLSTLDVVGFGALSAANAGSYVILAEETVGYITFGIQAAGSGGYSKQDGNALMNSSQTLSFFASVPIVEWES